MWARAYARAHSLVYLSEIQSQYSTLVLLSANNHAQTHTHTHTHTQTVVQWHSRWSGWRVTDIHSTHVEHHSEITHSHTRTHTQTVLSLILQCVLQHVELWCHPVGDRRLVSIVSVPLVSSSSHLLRATLLSLNTSSPPSFPRISISTLSLSLSSVLPPPITFILLCSPWRPYLRFSPLAPPPSLSLLSLSLSPSLSLL